MEERIEVYKGKHDEHHKSPSNEIFQIYGYYLKDPINDSGCELRLKVYWGM